MRDSIEYGILNTLLNYDKAIENDLESFLDYQLDYKLFKANRTTILVSKAIHNHLLEDIPFTAELIERYILKKTTLNLEEWIDLRSRLWFTFRTMNEYVKQLREIEENARISRMMKGIK